MICRASHNNKALIDINRQAVHIEEMYPVGVFILYPPRERTKKKKVPDFTRTFLGCDVTTQYIGFVNFTCLYLFIHD